MLPKRVFHLQIVVSEFSFLLHPVHSRNRPPSIVCLFGGWHWHGWGEGYEHYYFHRSIILPFKADYAFSYSRYCIHNVINGVSLRLLLLGTSSRFSGYCRPIPSQAEPNIISGVNGIGHIHGHNNNNIDNRNNTLWQE